MDASGAATWTNELARGLTLGQVRDSVAKGVEAQQNLEAIYQAVLGRGLDASGAATWTNELARGLTLEQVRYDIAHSPEAVGLRAGIYQAALARPGTAAEIFADSQYLANGGHLWYLREHIAYRASSLVGTLYQEVWGHPIDWATHYYYTALLARWGWTLTHVRAHMEAIHLETVVVPVLSSLSILLQ